MQTQTHKKIIKSLPREELLNMLTDLFSTLSDPTRIKILYALKREELCVKDLAQLTGISQSGISHQLSSLRKLKFVKTKKEGNAVYYSLSFNHLGAMLKEAENYADHIKRKLPDHPYKY
ncbi:MAG: ArsR/SmtB family transcription factor [Minisyncoccota bacterium]